MKKDSLLSKVTSQFAERYGSRPKFAASSPGRLNLIGEHVDYNDGIVMPAAIERWIVAAFAPNGGGIIRVHDSRFSEDMEIDLSSELSPVKGSWTNYIAGVIQQFRKLGWELRGFDVVMDSNVPIGGGLSSSAAMEALYATIIETLSGKSLDKMEKALLCQRAEHEFAGVPCGIMDQAAVIFGEEQHILKLDCRDLSIEPVPFVDSSLALMVIDSKVHHELADGEYGKRRATCEASLQILGLNSLREATMSDLENSEIQDDNMFRCVRHVVSEIQRTLDTIMALQANDYFKVGKLLNESHFSLRNDYRVSCPELDFITETARRQDGVYGSRMTGGGFGGSAIVLVEKNKVEAIRKAISSAYQAEFNLKREFSRPIPQAGSVPGNSDIYKAATTIPDKSTVPLI